MQQLFARFCPQLSDFIEQRDDLILLTLCAVNDAPLALQMLRDIEKATATDVFLLFANDFLSPGQFAAAALEHLREEHRLVCESLAQEGKELLPPFPEALFDEDLAAADRLRGGIEYARSLLPRDGGRRLGWGIG